MKKKLLSLILAVCTLAVQAPSSVFAAQPNYKEIYLDFLKTEFITKNNSNYWTNATLADLNLDGTPELIMYDGGAVSSNGAYIIQIIDNEPKIIYNPSSTSNNQANDYITSFDPNWLVLCGSYPNDNNAVYTFSLRKNKYTNELMYIHRGIASEMESHSHSLLCFSKDNLFNASIKFHEDIQADEMGDIENEAYYTDGNTVSKDAYQSAYNEFLDTWQDTGYKLSCISEFWENGRTLQGIEDFLNSYVPEKQALGINDEEVSPQYGYVDVMPLSREDLEDQYIIRLMLTNNSDKKIRSRRVQLICTTLKNSKTMQLCDVVVAYLDYAQDFEPFEEKISGASVHFAPAEADVAYTMLNSKFPSAYTLNNSSADRFSLLVIQFENDSEYEEFINDIKANNISDLSTDKNIENNAKWLKKLKGGN